MKDAYKIISVIPARGNSQRLPGKNILAVGGKPLIAHTIEASLGSKYIDTTVVSTDSGAIRKIALQYGAEAPFLRPAELASATSHSPDVVEHAVAYYEKHYKKEHDIIVMLQPTSPFRASRHTDEAIEKFLEDTSLDSLISVKKQEYPPWWMFKIEGNLLRTAFNFEEGVNVFNLERQQFPLIYRPNGAIYVTRRDYLKKTGSIVNPMNNGFYIMGQEDSIDIDTQEDLYCAEAEFKKRKAGR